MTDEPSIWDREYRGLSPGLSGLADHPRAPVQRFAREREALPFARGDAASHMLDAGGAWTALASLFVLLHRHTQHEDLVIAALLEAGGRLPSAVPLRAALAPAMRARELLDGLRATFARLSPRLAGVDMEQVARRLDPGAYPERNPLYQVAFAAAGDPELDPLAVQPAELERAFEAAIACDLVFALDRGAGGVVLRCEYDADQYRSDSIRRLLAQWSALACSLPAQRERALGELQFVPESERPYVVEAWPFGARVARPAATLHGLFETHAAQRPDAVAVEYDTGALTYRELDVAATRFARHLVALGVAPGQVVAACLHRSERVPIVALGILKAGAAYLPLDPEYPAERLRWIAQDSGSRAFVCEHEASARAVADTAGLLTVRLERVWESNRASDGIALEHSVAPSDLAYLIYTSGSTGRPKGVTVEHAAICNRLLHAEITLAPDDRVLQKTPLTFDVAMWDLFLPLVSGARLCLATPEGHRDSRYLVDIIRKRGITTIHFVPSMLRAFLAEPGVEDCRSLSRVTCSGEALPPDLVREFFARLPAVRLYNYYGPTEACVDVTFFRCLPDASDDRVPIGRPIENVEVHVLDPALQPVPIGVPGEIYIGGVGLARGYVNPEDARGRFVAHPRRPGGRLYATGDRGRWLPEGAIEYLGRLDHQLKIRGFRIEAGEVEAALLRSPAVLAAVATSRALTGPSEDLVAYVVPRAGQRLDLAALRSELSSRLPAYMVPARLIALDAMPLTDSGKVDRKRLPDPAAIPAASAGEPVSRPGFALERAIGRIWQRVLRRDAVQVNDNFFDLGGNSLLLAQVHAALEQELTVRVSRTDLFRYPTIATLARALSDGTPDAPQPPAARALPRERGAYAVIGMACRVPGANDLEQYWSLIRDGRRSMRELTAEELLEAGEHPQRIADPSYVRVGALLDGVAEFDADLFGFTAREAELTDPQHRLLLECAFEAMERAGYGSPNGRPRCGVFVGSLPSAYYQRYLAHDHPGLPPVAYYQVKIGNEADFLPTQIAYKLDLKGPAVTVQSACSTSLLAVHLACASLARGECDMVVAGGVSVRVPQSAGYVYQEGMVQSPDGHCRAFDDRARGTIFGSGAGIVVLRRLEDALRAGDRIHAVVRGTAVNNDGAAKVGYTAPSVAGQVEVVRQAWGAAGVSPDEVGYIEAHGTGTPLGDPIEVAALAEAFAPGGRTHACALGSVKANIGHLDAAAGIAGFIKAVMVVERGILPPAADLETPNTHIPWSDTPFFLPRQATPWPAAVPRIAGVSSFGIGGTNAHAVVQAPPSAHVPAPYAASERHHLFKLSARSDVALRELAQRYVDRLGSAAPPLLEDLCYTASAGRVHHPHRLCVVARSIAQLLSALRAFVAGRRERELFAGDAAAPAPTCLVLCAGASPDASELETLLGGATVTRLALERFCAAIGATATSADAIAGLRQASPQQRSLAMQYAIAALWRAWGVAPEAVLVVGGTPDLAAAASAFAAATLARERNASWHAADATPAIDRALDAAYRSGCRRLLLLGWDRAVAGRVRTRAETSGFEVLAAFASVRDLERSLLIVAAKAYVNGIDVPATCLDPAREGRRIELPTYPFQRKRFWLDRRARTAPAAGEARAQHSLLGRRIDLPLSDEVRFEAVFDRSHPPYVDHHRLFGTMVVPGASHIAMMLAASRELQGGPCCLHDVLFLHPFAVSESGSRRAQLVLAPDGGSGWTFKLVAEGERPDGRPEDWSLLFRGELRPAPAWQRDELSAEARAAIQARCPEVLSGRTFYRDVWVPGLDTGTSFHWIDTIWRGDGEALCLTARPAIEPVDGPLHAGLVEAAFQVLNSCWKYDNAALRRDGEIYVPFSIARYWYSGDASSDKLWVHARLVGHESAADESFTAHVKMYSERGELVVEVDAFESRRIQRARVEQALAGHAAAAHELRWERSEQVIASAGAAPSFVLAVGRRAPELVELAAALRACRVELVAAVAAAAGECRRAADGTFEADLSSAAALDALLGQATPEGTRCRALVDLRAATEPQPLDDADGCVQLGAELCAGALALVSAVRDSRRAAGMRLFWLTAGAQAVSSDRDLRAPLSATLWGLAAVVRLECPELRCTAIDVDSAHDFAGSLAAELLADSDELRVGYRDGQRYIARLRKSAAPPPPTPIRRDGSYVVTGALGGIGLHVAEWLAQQGAGHLVLMGRSAASDDARMRIRNLETRGTSVDVVRVDVADAEHLAAMRAALERVPSPVRGVIHAAGVLDDGSLARLDRARFERVMRPKVAGALRLAQVTRAEPLDFFVCFSSLSAALGAAGQGNYAAANAFMDALSHVRRSAGLAATSIAWGPWAEVGMAARLSERDRQRARAAGLFELEVQLGCRMLGEHLNDSRAVTLLARIDPQRYAAANAFAGDPALGRVRPSGEAGRGAAPERGMRQVLQAALRGEREELARALVTEIVRKVLGLGPLEPVEAGCGFVELGMDSLAVVDLRSRLQEAFELRLPSTFGFDFPTVNAVAEYVLRAIDVAQPAIADGPAAQLIDATIEAELAALEDALHTGRPSPDP